MTLSIKIVEEEQGNLEIWLHPYEGGLLVVTQGGKSGVHMILGPLTYQRYALVSPRR